MLNIATFEGKEAPDEAMRAMFAARKSVFVDLLKWDVPVLAGKYEIDQFDKEHARYLILSEQDGTHLASTRILPTTRPHILDSFYAAFCADGPPCGPTIREITRFCLDRRLRAAERREARDALVCRLVEYALINGITGYTAVASEGCFARCWRSGGLVAHWGRRGTTKARSWRRFTSKSTATRLSASSMPG
jgi:acyl-homoserine lactone synthase